MGFQNERKLKFSQGLVLILGYDLNKVHDRGTLDDATHQLSIKSLDYVASEKKFFEDFSNTSLRKIMQHLGHGQTTW